MPIWEQLARGQALRPGHRQPRATWPGRRATRPAPRPVQARRRGRPAAHRRGGRTQPGPDPARQGPPRRQRRGEGALLRPGGRPPAHRAGARQQQPAGLRQPLSFIYYDMSHAGDGQAGRQPGHQQAEEIATGKYAGGREDGRGQAHAGRTRAQAGQGRRGRGRRGGAASCAEDASWRAGTGYTPEMKKAPGMVYNTLGLVALKRKEISPTPSASSARRSR